MTDTEILEWLAMLSRHPAQQREIVEDLLKHRRGDKMTPEDIKVCRRAVVLLSNGKVVCDGRDT